MTPNPNGNEPASSTTDVAHDEHFDQDERYKKSYTGQRLQHASAQHLHLTSRRCFIGPIPPNWLRSHKSWYKQQLHIPSYSSKAVTFSADHNVTHQRSVTGLDGPSAAAMFRRSFPQPTDVNEEEEEENEQAGEQDSESDGEPANSVGRPSNEEDMQPIEPLFTNMGSAAQPINISEPLEDSRSEAVEPASLPNNSGLNSNSGKKLDQQATRSSFVTAKEHQASSTKESSQDADPAKSKARKYALSSTEEEPTPPPEEDNVRQSSGSSQAQLSSLPADATASTSSLLPRKKNRPASSLAVTEIRSKKSSRSLAQAAPEEYTDGQEGDLPVSGPRKMPTGGSLIRFNIPERVKRYDTAAAKNKFSEIRHSTKFRRDHLRPGEVVKTERMLVRVDFTQQEVPPEYDENDSQKVETRTLEKWREFIVVCRKSANKEFDFVLEICKTRVVPTVKEEQKQQKSAHVIPMVKKTTRVNLYSSLDKTIVIWTPFKKGTKIYLLRPRSSANSVEWFTFLQSALGWKRATDLTVNVPDLAITLKILDPFGQLDRDPLEDDTDEGGSKSLQRMMAAEQAAVATIIQRSMELLAKSPEWASVISTWSKSEKMGLAWKRYDRLEWVHGANERKMFGSLGMQKTHDLELRPKQHYPTHVHRTAKGGESVEEPTPVEGFLIRRTSQKGHDQRLGQKYQKKLYFSTHNQYLTYCKPARAEPPAYRDSVSAATRDPRTTQEEVPLIYAINPFPVKHGKLEWLDGTGVDARRSHDRVAFGEAERRVNTLLASEGYINLCHVVEVRSIKGSTSADQEDAQASENANGQASHLPPKEPNQDQQDTHSCFELVLENGLVARLQAFNEAGKDEWILRLTRLVEYWKSRITADMNLYKQVRNRNFERLKIDEEMESYVGQEARKWEVSQSIASPQLFNMCGISACRTITMSGVLYQKPRVHSTFKRCGVILCHGHLLLFQGTLRKHTGKEIPHILHERTQNLDLKDCYVYSGFATEDSLLYQNRTFDSNHPGHHALPRVYLEDSWTSSDEDFMTCFVIWHGQKKSLFRASKEEGEGKTWRMVSRLGVKGRSIVFKTRSRAERDHWVMSIGLEIERLQQGEDIRVTEDVS
ncbi:hypothetical protein MMC25_002923 [Agyrium rufum]|nr:hypothetical protein [Agyrium rufum]